MDREKTAGSPRLPGPRSRVGKPFSWDEYGFLKDLILGMRCGVLSIDRQGKLVVLNEPAVQILELDTAPPVGAPMEEALRDHPQFAQILRESFTMSSLPNRAELELRCRDRGKTIGFTLSLVAGVDGLPYAAAAFFKDLTQVEQKEEQDRLKDRLAALGQMAASMAHEIRNPLASIEVSCSLLKRRIKERGSERDLVDKVIAEVGRLNRTINSCLDFVRPVSLNLAPADITPVLERALRLSGKRRGGPGITIVKRLDSTIPPFLMDRSQVRRVFENLFLNALEAMGETGVLTVESSVLPAPPTASVPYAPHEAAARDPWQGFESYVQVRVSDTGPGISEEHQDKLFYPFFTTKKDGSGVGLPMAKKIVDSHRGLLDVASSPGKGAAFTVRLPLIGAGSED